jgi:hypothetical protein
MPCWGPVDVTMTSHRLAPLLHEALLALVTGELPRVEVFAPDVVVESPHLTARSRSELLDRMEDRRGGLADVEVVLDLVDAGPVGVDVTWRFTAVHAGPILVNEDELFEPTGRRIGGGGTTHFDVGNGCIWRVVVGRDDAVAGVSAGEQPELL